MTWRNRRSGPTEYLSEEISMENLEKEFNEWRGFVIEGILKIIKKQLNGNIEILLGCLKDMGVLRER